MLLEPNIRYICMTKEDLVALNYKFEEQGYVPYDESSISRLGSHITDVIKITLHANGPSKVSRGIQYNKLYLGKLNNEYKYTIYKLNEDLLNNILED